MRGDRRHIAKKTRLVDVDSEQLGQLIDDNHQADAGLEPGQDRLRNEIGDKAETQGARGQQHRPDEDGKRGRRHERSSAGSAASASPIALAHRMAMGVVVLTLSTREVPRTA